MLLSYNADLLPRVRMMGQIRYSQPWIHFRRCSGEYILYVIRDGDMYLQKDGQRYHLRSGDFFLLEPGLLHEGYQKAVCEYYYAHFTHPDMKRRCFFICPAEILNRPFTRRWSAIMRGRNIISAGRRRTCTAFCWMRPMNIRRRAATRKKAACADRRLLRSSCSTI